MSWRESVPNFGRGIFYILLSLGHYSNAINRFLVHPDDVLYRDEGSNVVFEWDFHIGSRTQVEFIFGEWAADPGYVKKEILNVQGHNQVNKRPGFETKVDWSGNVYECVNCKAVVVMYNLTLADFKSYGVVIVLGVGWSTLKNSLRLVKTEPANITKWAQNIEVHEGNSTTIECRASGLPPPSVKIERNNQTLKTCNDMKPCLYKIQAATFEDQGEYVCLVQQGNSSVIISPSLNLTVLKTRKTSTAKIIAAPKENLVWLWILLGVFGFIIITIVVCWCIVYRCCPDQLPSECCRNVCHGIWRRCRGEYEAANPSIELDDKGRASSSDAQ